MNDKGFLGIQKRFNSGEYKDYYDALGVSRDATDKDIKRAFRKLAKEYHPDRHKGDKEKEKKFQTYSAAYDVLSDPKKRKDYDMMGHQAYSDGGHAHGAPDIEDILNQFGFGGGGGGFGDFGSMFGEGFGGGRSQRKPQGRPGQNLEVAQTISFMESVTGTKREISYTTKVPCEPCKGFGTSDGKKPPTCPSCGGSGTQTASQGGLFFIQQTCSACNGSGEKITNRCTSCSGKGTTTKKVNLEVSIPSGVNNQDTLRIPRKGCAGEKGGPAGDLFISVKVQPHEYFRRENNDIHLEVPVTISQAIFGSTVKVPTVHNKILEVTVKPGTQSGEKNILRGKGISRKGRFDVGNQILTWKVVIPSASNLSETQKELFDKIKNEETLPNPFKLE
mmetsp:Transcript_7115/g.8822  ORF Transcript_7115/g.8822 Transcript_7115/m.8822 type:complete len:390 (-) Transcript_7115:145-1314(-)